MGTMRYVGMCFNDKGALRHFYIYDATNSDFINGDKTTGKMFSTEDFGATEACLDVTGDKAIIHELKTDETILGRKVYDRCSEKNCNNNEGIVDEAALYGWSWIIGKPRFMSERRYVTSESLGIYDFEYPTIDQLQNDWKDGDGCPVNVPRVVQIGYHENSDGLLGYLGFRYEDFDLKEVPESGPYRSVTWIDVDLEKWSQVQIMTNRFNQVAGIEFQLSSGAVEDKICAKQC